LKGWIIKSIDAETLALLNEYNIDLEEGKRIYNFVVTEIKDTHTFYLSMDTEESYVIAEYK